MSDIGEMVVQTVMGGLVLVALVAGAVAFGVGFAVGWWIFAP